MALFLEIFISLNTPEVPAIKLKILTAASSSLTPSIGCCRRCISIIRAAYPDHVIAIILVIGVERHSKTMAAGMEPRKYPRLSRMLFAGVAQNGKGPRCEGVVRKGRKGGNRQYGRDRYSLA